MTDPRSDRPPRVSEALLGWLLADDWQTPLGDFEEYYHALAQAHGTRRARWWYRGQVARLLPDRLIAKTYWGIHMLKNYAVLAYRTLLKNGLSSAINLFGLSIAVGCSVVVYLFLQGYLRLDRFHEHADAIFLVEHTLEREGGLQTWGTSPQPLGPALAEAFPQVERTVRLNGAGGLVHQDDELFEEWVLFADTGFFDMFTFPLAHGTPEALADPNAVFLSEPTARKYFGRTDVLGEEMTLTFGKDRTAVFTVKGVAEPFPGNAGLQFHVLLNYDRQRDLMGVDPDDWAGMTRATFVQMRDPADITALAARMEPYLALQNAARDDWTVQSFVFDNLKNPARDAFLVQRRMIEAPHPGFILMLVAIPLAMMALSCFNYVNIALGSASRRLREIGVRKVMGGTRRQLIAQFMAENLLLCFLSLVVGLGVAVGFLVPLFNSIFVNQIVVGPLIDNPGLWLFLVGLLAFVGFASGAYPAFYVSSFQPVSILRGRQRLGDRRWFTRFFLTFQFVLTFITIIIGVYLTLNGRYILRQDWGYEAEQTLVVRVGTDTQYTRLRDVALGDPNVVGVAGAVHHVGESMGQAVVEIDGQMTNRSYYGVGASYFEVLGLRLAEGRFPAGDARGTAVINAAFAEAEAWTEPVGRTFRVEGTTYTVVGVVEDFLVHPMLRERPIFFMPADEAAHQYLAIRTRAGAGIQTADALEATWERLFPETPFLHFFQDEVFDAQYRSYTNVVQAFSYIAALALLISCMGLFGLASQNMARRLKEVSIRKVLGASVARITLLVNRGFLLMLAVAAVLASVVCYVGLTTLFTAFEVNAIHLPMGPEVFAFAYLLVFITAALSVATQVRRLVAANPAEVLRSE